MDGDDEREWCSRGFGEYRKKRVTAIEYTKDKYRFLVAFETALTHWKIDGEKLSYSLMDTFTFSEKEGFIQEIAISESNRYIALRR